MEFNVLSTCLIALIFIFGYFVLRYIQILKNQHRLSKHRHTCEILEVDGYTPTLNFTRIPELWKFYSFDGVTYDKYSFKEAVIKKFVSRVNEMSEIEKVVAFFLTYTEVQRLRTVSNEDKEMISDIYTKVCHKSETRVMLLAHHRYDKLKVLPKGDDKDRLMVQFGLLLDHSCIKNYFPLSKTILDMEANALLQKARDAKRQKHATPVIEMKEILPATGEANQVQ